MEEVFGPVRTSPGVSGMLDELSSLGLALDGVLLAVVKLSRNVLFSGADDRSGWLVTLELLEGGC